MPSPLTEPAKSIDEDYFLNPHSRPITEADDDIYTAPRVPISGETFGETDGEDSVFPMI